MKSSLPPLLQELAEAIGQGAALALAQEFGGQELYVPRRMTKKHPIAVAIGLEAAEKLAAGWPGTRLEIPLAVAHNRAIRHAQIVRAAEALKSKAAAARQFKTTTRWVRILTNRAPTKRDRRQGDLF